MNTWMKKNIKIFILIYSILFATVIPIKALEVDTHEAINKHIAKNAFNGFSFDEYLKKQLGIQEGKDTLISNKEIIKWLGDGGEMEDSLLGIRFLNHFLDPISNTGLAGQYSALQWALMDTGSQSVFGNYSWQDARSYYYKALTDPDKATRERNFAKTFRALGQVMHLVQDISVPEHARKDLHGFGSDYENWVDIKERPKIKTYDPTSLKFFAPSSDYHLSITNIFDTGQYNEGSTPDITLQGDIGLSEYTNANFLSPDTIFTGFTYPADSDMSEQPVNDVLYLVKNGDEGTEKYLARAQIFYKYLPVDYKKLALTTNDNEVHKNYANNLIPRAIGYSSQALSYFFRGSIEISLPGKGTYALIKDPNQGFFSSITLLAKNNSPEGEEMSDGSIDLVVKYKLAYNDPFKNSSYPITTSSNFFYAVVHEANNIRSIPRSPLELTFDLSDNQLPLWATDVYLQVIYKGQLGSEDNAVAVGFKDICEPTPLDIINSMDKICLENEWYSAGSADAIAVVDSNNNGIADTNEWDVYPHNLADIFFTFLPSNDLHYPSCTEDDIYYENLPAGDYLRVFILSDYDYCFSFCGIAVIPTHPDDQWVSWLLPNILCSGGIKNQTELVDSEACSVHGVNPPCYIKYYPAFSTVNGIDRWVGMNFRNKPFPEGSSCSTE